MTPDNFDIWDAHERKMERAEKEHMIGCYAVCDEAVYDYDSYYDINGELVHDDCGLDWLMEYRINN